MKRNIDKLCVYLTSSSYSMVPNDIKLDVWINQILGNLTIVAPYLDIAFKQGLIEEQHSPWAYLKIIAKLNSKSTVVTKAKLILQK